MACLTPQESKRSKGLLNSENFGCNPSVGWFPQLRSPPWAKLPEIQNWQHEVSDELVFQTRVEHTWSYAIKRWCCWLGWTFWRWKQWNHHIYFKEQRKYNKTTPVTPPLWESECKLVYNGPTPSPFWDPNYVCYWRTWSSFLDSHPYWKNFIQPISMPTKSDWVDPSSRKQKLMLSLVIK